MFDFLTDEHSSPALDMQSKLPLRPPESDARDRMVRKLQQLAFLRQGHDGPEVGTRYNLPSQGG